LDSSGRENDRQFKTLSEKRRNATSSTLEIFESVPPCPPQIILNPAPPATSPNGFSAEFFPGQPSAIKSRWLNLDTLAKNCPVCSGVFF